MKIYRLKGGQGGRPPLVAILAAFLHSLRCLALTQNNVEWVVVGRWKSAGEWSYVGGSNNVVYDMWDPSSVGHASRRLL